MTSKGDDPAVETVMCAHCRVTKPVHEMYRCTHCKSEHYCNELCSIQDWLLGHRDLCAGTANTADAANTSAAVPSLQRSNINKNATTPNSRH